MAQDSRDLDLDIANSFATAPYLGEPQFGFLNIIGTPTDDLVDVDIYAFGPLDPGSSQTFYVGGVLNEMRVTLMVTQNGSDFTNLARYQPGTAYKLMQVNFTVPMLGDVYLKIEDVPGRDRFGDDYAPEPYVITHDANLAFAQGSHSNAFGDQYVYDGESGEAGSFAGIDHDLPFQPEADPVYQTGTRLADILTGANAADRLEGLDGNDALRGLLGNDLIIGGRGDDLIYGNQGQDTLFGESQDDRIFGGQDRDFIYGNLGDDVLYGNMDADWLYGGDRSDTLFGGRGDDRLFGNDGDDLIFGNRGDDAMFGGAGADIFVVSSDTGRNVIFDFNFAEGDRIAMPGGAKVEDLPEGLLLQQVGSDAQVILIGVHDFSESYLIGINFQI
jgi:hypothetical protein